MLTREKYIESPVEIKLELQHFFNKKDQLTIFDIGACEAEDSIRYSNLFPNATIYAFEPRKDNYQKAMLLTKQYNKSKIFLENVALSNQNGTAEFYLSEGEPEHVKNTDEWDYGNKSSSLLPPSAEMKKHTGWLKFNQKTEVKTTRLENYVLKKNISSIDFAHIDVQGAELMVLEGAGKFLHQIKLIWMEVESIPLYKNQPVKKDVADFMRSNNFVNILDTVDNISGDQLFCNKSFFSEKQMNELVAARKRVKKISRLKSFLKLNWFPI